MKLIHMPQHHPSIYQAPSAQVGPGREPLCADTVVCGQQGALHAGSCRHTQNEVWPLTCVMVIVCVCACRSAVCPPIRSRLSRRSAGYSSASTSWTLGTIPSRRKEIRPVRYVCVGVMCIYVCVQVPLPVPPRVHQPGPRAAEILPPQQHKHIAAERPHQHQQTRTPRPTHRHMDTWAHHTHMECVWGWVCVGGSA